MVQIERVDPSPGMVDGPVQPGGTKFESYTQPRSEKAKKRFLDRFTPAPTE